MAYSKPIQISSWPAAADLSAKQFLAVRLNGVNKLALCGAGDSSVGILQNKPTLAPQQQGDVITHGISKAFAGAAFTDGEQLAADAAGKLVRATAGDTVIAVALEDASGADVLAAVHVLGAAGTPAQPFMTFGIGAEAANIILITAQLRVGGGAAPQALPKATRVHVKSMRASGTLTIGASGTMQSGTTTVEAMCTTDATGLLTINVTDAAAESIDIMFTPDKGVPTFATLVFV